MNRARLTLCCVAALALAACGTPPAVVPDGGALDAGSSDAGGFDAGAATDAGVDAGTEPGPDGGADAGSLDAGVDLDLDGLDDAEEARLASEYLPYLAVHPADACSLGGIVYRLRKHPQNPALIHVIYDHLFQTDCGLTSHVGDNEVFAVTINPAKPMPAGLTAMKAISHQGTACEKTTACGSCNGLSACEQASYDAGTRPLVYSSKDKHASYVTLNGCNFLSCLDTCAAAALPNVPLVNAGEPGAPLVSNLTTQAFVNAAAGWTETSLYNYDPWDAGADFGSAGSVGGDLIDPAFLTEACP